MTEAQSITWSHKDPAHAFAQAIIDGRLSSCPTSPVYGGKFMYMGTYNGKDQFKHINTRRYAE